MARKEITTPLDLKNLENHNDNYDELYGLIDETDRRISEDMWEEIKDANTMKMLEPVQTAADLPSEAADKSLITVIDEQRVYGFVNGEWQPFNQIDLDPFEPFKDELAEIVAAYEKQIQNITQEVQSTKDSAVDSIESTQSQSESNIENTKQSAINSVNKAQQEAERQIDETAEALKGKTSELTTMFNDYLEQLTSNRDTALGEVENAKQEAQNQIDESAEALKGKTSELTAMLNDYLEQLTSNRDTTLNKVEDAKQEALDALEAFNNTDTSGWQKHKLTRDDGKVETIGGFDFEDTGQLDNLVTGVYYLSNAKGVPEDASSDDGFIFVYIRDSGEVKRIEYKPYNSSQTFVKSYYKSWRDWS